jgi:UDP-GlcNAc:undecaprenyl-phosphate GlcNAc-1-phosphate transferase
MSIAFVFAVLLLDVPLTPYRFLFAGIMLLVLVGVLDDLRELSPEQRLWAQILAALLMVGGGGIVLDDLGHLLASEWLLSLGVLAWPITVFATVGVINAMNMSDGLDGLAASFALITLGSLSLFAWRGEDYGILSLLLMLVLVVLPFLTVNLRSNGSAQVFMGDAGSMFLGFSLAWLLIQASQGEGRLMAPVTALWIFALPLLDTITLLIRRSIMGRSPFLGDREHLHHLLLLAGFTERQTLLLMVALATAAAAFGVAGERLNVPEPWMFGGFVALFGLYFWTTLHMLRRRRLPRTESSSDLSDRLVAHPRTGAEVVSTQRAPRSGSISG